MAELSYYGGNGLLWRKWLIMAELAYNGGNEKMENKKT